MQRALRGESRGKRIPEFSRFPDSFPEREISRDD